MDYQSNNKNYYWAPLAIAFLLIIAMLQFPCAIQANTDLENAKTFLKHADTYYWLARARGDSVFELKKSEDYAQKALAALNSIMDAEDTQTVDQLKRSAQAQIDDFRAEQHIAMKYISNRLPLYKSLVGRMSFYDSMDANPDEAASRNGIKELVGQFNARITFLTNQPLVMILVDTPDTPKQKEVEEVAYAYLGEHTTYNIVNPLELGKVLDNVQKKSLRKYKFDPEKFNPEKEESRGITSIFGDIASHYGSDSLSIVSLIKEDTVDNQLYYYAVHFSWWWDTTKVANKPKRPFEPGFVVRGFCDSTQSRSRAATLFIVGIFLLCTLVPLLFTALFKTKHQDFKPFLLGGLTFSSGVILIFLAFRALGKISPPDDAYYFPYYLVWALVAGAVISILPLIASYFASIRLNPALGTSRRRDAISSIAFGALASGAAVLGYHSVLRFGALITFPYLLIWLVLIFLMAHKIAVSFESYQSLCHLSSRSCAPGESGDFQGSRRAMLARNEMIAAVLVVILISASVFLWDPNTLYSSLARLSGGSGVQWSKLWPLYLSLALTVVLLSFHMITKYSLGRDRETTKQEVQAPEEGAISLDWLSNTISKPKYIKHPERKTLETAEEFILNGKGINVVLIEAGRGCGKSRMVDEIVARIQKNEKQPKGGYTVFYGKCSESGPTTPVISYEPFTLALGEHLHIGVFEDARTKAEKLKQWLPRIEKVLGAAIGIPAFYSLLNLESHKGDERTSVEEIVSAILGFLKTKANESTIVFIIDDMQWMDESTAKLSDLLLKRLLFEDEDAPICFILTTQGQKEAHKAKRVIKIVEDLRVKDGGRVHRIGEEELKNESLPAALIKELRFEHRSCKELAEYFSICREYRPLHILQLLKTLLQSRQIDLSGPEFRLKKGTDLNSVPPPGDLAGMVKKQIEALDRDIISVLEAAALMGVRFRADYLAEVYGLERVKLLRILREAENTGIIHGHDEFGVFMFDSVYMQAALSGRLGGPRLTQLGKEYLIRYVEVVEKDLTAKYESLEKAPQIEIADLAERAYSIRDVIPDKCVELNWMAGERSYRSGRFEQGEKQFESALSILKEYEPEGSERRLRVLKSYSQHILDSQTEIEVALNNLKEIRQMQKEDTSLPGLEADLLLMESLANYKNGKRTKGQKFYEAASECAAKVLNLKEATVCQRLRAEFYAAISISLEEPENRKKAHEDLLRKVDEILDSGGLNNEERSEVLKLQSEALNNFGFTLIGLKDHRSAIAYFNKALACLRQINDIKGRAFSHGGLGDCYEALGDDELALKHYGEDLQISRQCGDLFGMMRMSIELGNIMKKKRDHEKAAEYFKEAYSYAESARDHTGKLLAVAGIISTALERYNLDSRMEITGRIEQLESMKDEFPSCPKWARDSIIEDLKQVQENKDFDYADKLARIINGFQAALIHCKD